MTSTNYYIERPIYGTNLKRDKSVILSDLRSQMADIRGGISDFQFAYPEWKGRTEHVEGLLTCGLIALYTAIEELRVFEETVRLHEAKGD